MIKWAIATYLEVLTPGATRLFNAKNKYMKLKDLKSN